MSDPMLAWRFKVSAALGLLDAAWINLIGAQVLAWIAVALGLGLGFGSALPHALWWQAVAVTASAASVIAALWLMTRVAIDRQLFAALAGLADAPDSSASLTSARSARSAASATASIPSLSSTPSTSTSTSPTPTPTAASRLLGGLDQALLELGWISPAKADRPLDARVQGVKNLLRQTVILLVLQILILIVIAMERYM